MTKAEFDKVYANAVAECRKVLHLNKNKQMIIAGWAQKLCDTRHGGRKIETPISEPTIARFAKDLNLNERTVYEWIRIKRRIYDPLPEAKRKGLNFGTLQRCIRRIKASDSAKRVEAIINDELESPPESIRFRKYLGHLRTILYNAERPQNLEFADAETLQKMVQYTQQINDKLRVYLSERHLDKNERKRRFKTKLYKNVVRKNVHAVA